MTTSESAAVWSSTRVDGSSARVERGMGPTKRNPMHCNVGWFYGDCTIILDGGGDRAPDEISEVAALWDVPVRAEDIDAADHGFLIIACTRQFGGLHTQIDDSRVSISINGQQLDYFGLRDIPPGHTDYFHLPRREPHWPWLTEVDPILASCQTIYTWPIQPTHLKSQKAQTVQVRLDPQVGWDIDYVGLLLHRSQPSLPYAQMWTNGCKGRCIAIDEKDFQRVFENKTDYDAFVHYKGDFRLGIVKEVVLGEMTVLESVNAEQGDSESKAGNSLTRHGFRILIKSLRNEGERESFALLGKECWIENPGFVRSVEVRWNEYLNAENLYDDFRKVAGRITKEISVLNKTLSRCGIDSVIKTERGLYWMSSIPRYCIIEENEN